MPIRGLSDKRRLPRAGKIKLGVMVQGAGGKTYPRASDHFVCPSEVLDALKVERPKELPIMFPTDDPEQIFPQAYKMYKTSGLYCAGDGEHAKRWREGELIEIDCPCPFLESGECGAVATLNFLLPEVPGIGVWQIDTGNKTSITTINTALEQFRASFGGLRGIPFLLKLEPHQTQRYDEKKREMVKTQIYAMRLDSPFSLRQIVEYRAKQGKVEALMAPPLSQPGPEVKALEAGEPEPDATQQLAHGANLEEVHRGAAAVSHTLPRQSGVAVSAEQTARATKDNPDLPASMTHGILEAQAELRAGLGQPYQMTPDDAPWDVSMCFAAAAKCGVRAPLYELYLSGFYGVPGSDLPDLAVAKEAAKFRALVTEEDRQARKKEMIEVVNGALKKQGKGLLAGK